MSYGEYDAMVKTEKRMSAQEVCYAEVLFQPSFSMCGSTRCLRNMRLPTRWLGSGLRNGAHRASQNVTVHRLSADTQDLLSTAHLHDSRLYQAKERKHVAQTIHVFIVPSCVVFFRSTRATHHGPMWVYTSHMVAELMVAPLESTAVCPHDH